MSKKCVYNVFCKIKVRTNVDIYRETTTLKGQRDMELNELIVAFAKRKNVSVSAEKTMKRCAEVWKALKNAQKSSVFELADVSNATVHRTYKTGHISAPVVVAISRAAGCSPLYLSGISDKRGKFTEKTLDAFLDATGYSALSEHHAEETSPEHQHSDDQEDECECCKTIELEDEELIDLFRALLIKARFNEAAAEKAEHIGSILCE